MKVRYHKTFLKNYKKRIATNKRLERKFLQQLEHFLKNPTNPSLRDHKLVGKKSSYRAFSVTGDIRVIYRTVEGELWLYDIGSHNQVY
ncbi:MAG: type II toxin-antitoxin system mRNA interferase toxin, RelE/StbE family [Candidatus Levybacteria bacterium]|nr:type II toxin-antitoxin system mRNA interferase toxin, RelE/StbE family [Candidatus Levybacteria bacterium]